MELECEIIGRTGGSVVNFLYSVQLGGYVLLGLGVNIFK